MQEIIIYMIVAASVFYTGKYLYKKMFSKKCANCALNQLNNNKQ